MTKDLSRSQYHAAAKKQGFKPSFFGLEDVSGKTPGTIYGAIAFGGKIRRRATLANAMQERQRNSK